jgi:hypothetical protein
MLVVLVLSACAPEKQAEQKPRQDDGCVGYVVKPDGSRKCLPK